jgi:hypothetical protein
MAKEQELPLNPQKISGLCGRLLCCLSYEEDGYREMGRTLPRMGQRCSTPTGEGKVISINILKRQITLYVPDMGRVEVTDRDLGTVVRWDAASKAGEPPPSISRADAIAQGMIEADEQDQREAEGIYDLEPEPFDTPGRGRLPQRQQTRRLPQPPRPGTAEPGAPDRDPSGGGQPQRGRRQRGRPAAREGGRQDQPPQQQAPRGPRPPRPERAQGPADRGAARPADRSERQDRGERPERSERPERPQLPGASRSFQRTRPPAVERPERPTPPPPPPRAQEPKPPGEGGEGQPGGGSGSGRRRNRGRNRGNRPTQGGGGE